MSSTSSSGYKDIRVKNPQQNCKAIESLPQIQIF